MKFPRLSLIPRHSRLRRRRTKCRRGRVIDRKYLAWIHTRPSLVWTHDPGCSGYCYVTAHHVKECPGSAKNDHRAVPLWRCHHLLGFGWYTVEHGRVAWENRYRISLENEICRLREAYVEIQEHAPFHYSNFDTKGVQTEFETRPNDPVERTARKVLLSPRREL